MEQYSAVLSSSQQYQLALCGALLQHPSPWPPLMPRDLPAPLLVGAYMHFLVGQAGNLGLAHSS